MNATVNNCTPDGFNLPGSAPIDSGVGEMDTALRDRRVVITGASEGIGAGVSRCFAAEGARLAVCARRPQPLQALADELGTAADVRLVTADMTDAGDVQRFAGEVDAAFGGVDVLVNAVGGADRLAGFDELSDDDWLASYELNLLSAVRVTRAFLPLLRRAGGGRIINIASESGLQPDPFMPHYNAAKAALINFSKSLSKALAGEGILVNCVSPAMTRNAEVEAMIAARARDRQVTPVRAQRELLAEFRPNIVLGRPGEPHEVGAAVVFLASAPASFVTGANLRVDGGSVASI